MITNLVLIIVGIFIACLLFFLIRKINQKLSEVTGAVDEARKFFTQSLGNTTTVFSGVYEKLGKLEETNRQIVEISRDISALQQLLRAPKFRGQLGERMLENLLAEVLPKQYFALQYRFKTGDAVDAVIKLAGKVLSIDAKFSLENFQRLQEAVDEDAKNSFRKRFTQDVKNRIDEISSKYILPDEGTYDFAFMYIPAENVYYEIIVNQDMLGIFTAKKIIPVSPNTFYAYLEIICMGLKGLQIEENAKAILKGLSALGVQMNKFQEDFTTLGAHINNTRGKFEESFKHLEKITQQLEKIQEKQS
ncbi:MAG: DNA recombination protein RmuC [Candidatus Omnitrophica bacterium]|jgi:DNA recombination protein RmuC|nr:DNA recombination protein RmuC [Candidatus Omnitrophota bacterium]